MIRYIVNAVILIFLASHVSLYADGTLEFKSSSTQTTLIELFTSQGCSSTPPAEKYLNSLTTHPDLWKEFVPVSYHVDYWNHLGWEDPYSSREYTDRQKEYRKAKIIPNLYTPGFMVNGKPWIGWHLDHPVPLSEKKSGILEAKLSKRKLDVKYTGSTGNLQLHVAVLGFNINTDIKRGENRDRRYRQDFIVLKQNVYNSDKGIWTVNMPDVELREAEKLALAIWISRKDDPAPLQAAGGWMD